MDTRNCSKMVSSSKKRLGERMLVAEKGETIVGINGIISERNSGKGGSSPE